VRCGPAQPTHELSPDLHVDPSSMPVSLRSTGRASRVLRSRRGCGDEDRTGKRGRQLRRPKSKEETPKEGIL
jgi:hypothetical protein